MRLHLLAIALFVSAIGTSTAHASVPVAIDCHLETGEIDCRSLESAYFRSLHGLVERTPGAAITIAIRATRTGRAVDYAARTAGISLTERVSDSVEQALAIERVLALLQRATLPFVPLRAPASAEDGALRLQTEDAIPTSDEDDASPVYLMPALGAEVFQQGIRVVAIGAELEAGLSLPDVRLLANGEATFRYVSLSIPGGDQLEGSTFSAVSSVVAAHTIDGGLSAALLFDAGRFPQNNLDGYATAGVGIEWVNVPIRHDDEDVYGARYRVLGVHQDYVTPNQQNRSSALFARHSLTAFASVHASAIDVRGDVTATTLVDQPRFWEVRGNVEVAFRLATGLELGVESFLTYRGDAIHAPADRDGLDPVAVVVSGSDFGTLSYGAELSISYAFGNGLLHTRDQRWRR